MKLSKNSKRQTTISSEFALMKWKQPNGMGGTFSKDVGGLPSRHRQLLPCENESPELIFGTSEDWRSGYQDSGNELSIYIALIAGYQIGIRRGASSI
jgi:hypothetical protein